MRGAKAPILGTLLIVFLLVAATPASAHMRTLTVEVNDGTSAVIRSESAAGGDEMDFRFKAERGGGSSPTIKLEVESETRNQGGGQEVEIEFRAVFREVSEFEDANGNGLQDPQEAPLSSIRLDSLTFASVEVADDSTTAVAGYKVTVQGTSGGFSFGLVSHVFPSNAQLNGILVPEQAVKVDILLSGYPYTSATSLLALVIKTNSSVQRQPEHEDGSRSVEVASERGTAFFRWDPQAQVDGRDMPVNAEWRADFERLSLYYPHGDVIVHDPLVGFESGSSLLPILLVVGGVAVAAVTVATLAVRRGRRRRRQLYPRP